MTKAALLYISIFILGGLSLATVATSDTLNGCDKEIRSDV